MNEPNAAAQQAQHAASAIWQRAKSTTGQQVLFLLALLFVGLFTYWWYAIWSMVTQPASIIEPVGVFTLVLALVYGVVEPLFISMLLPNSPTGMYLQRQTWAYPGQIAVGVATIVLGVFGYFAMQNWLVAQLAVKAPDMVGTTTMYAMLVAALVGAALVPAIQFAYQPVGQQLLLINQAHEIKKLMRLHSGEIAVLEGRLARAKAYALMEWVALLPAQRDEAFYTIQGIMLSIADTQRRIVRLTDVPGEIERALGIPEDAEIKAQVEELKRLMLNPAGHIERVYYVEQDAPAAAPAIAPPAPAVSPAAPRSAEPDEREARQDAIPVSPQELPREAAPRRPAAPRSAPQRYAAEWQTASIAFGATSWTVRRLAEVLDMKERTARERLDAWLSDGRAAAAESKGHYYLTECEQP